MVFQRVGQYKTNKNNLYNKSDNIIKKSMRYISTTDTNITFTDTNGKVMIVPKNRVYTHFNVDTVTFLLIERYDNEGICIFTTIAEDLEINGTTYTYEQLLDGEGISDLFSPTGLSFEVVEELPQTGEEGVIYLVPNEDETYTEYIWIADEERFELIGTTDVDLTNYYTKAQVDALIPTNVSDLTNDAGYITQTAADSVYATQVVVNEEIASRIEAIREVNTALGTKADKSDTYTKTQVDTALAAKVSQSEFDTKEEVISTALNSLDRDKQDKLTAGSNITIENNVISSTSEPQVQADWNQTDTTAVDYIKNKPDTSDFVTKTEYNPKELAIAQALTDLNENKADKSEIPVVPDMSNYYTKTETDNTFVTQADWDVKEEVISAGLNTLNTSKANASDVYTKTEIDAMIGNINTILASI